MEILLSPPVVADAFIETFKIDFYSFVFAPKCLLISPKGGHPLKLAVRTSTFLLNSSASMAI